MRMVRVRVEDETFDWLTHRAQSRETSLAAFVRDMLTSLMIEGRADAAPVSEPSDTVQPLAPGKIGRPTVEQWERLNKWLAATGRQPEPGEITTKSGLLAWAVGQGFQP